MPSGTPRPVVVDGVSYPSIAAAARAIGITRQCLQARVVAALIPNRERPIDMGENRRDWSRLPHPVVVMGLHYPSWRAAMRATGHSFRALVRHVETGEPLKGGRKKITES